MSYRSDIPAEANLVRGVSGDLMAMQENFEILVGLVQQPGLTALILASGSAVSGTAQWNGSQWGPGTILSGIRMIRGNGATSGQAFVYNSSTDTWEPGSVAAAGSGGGGGVAGLVMMTMASGQTDTLSGDAITFQITGINTVRLNSGGFTATSGSITVPTTSGYEFVRLLAGVAISGSINTGHFHLGFRKNAVSGAITDDAGAQYVSFDPNFRGLVAGTGDQEFTVASPLIPVSGGEVFTVHVTADNLSGAPYTLRGGDTPFDGTKTWFSLEAYRATSGVTVISGGGSAEPQGEYLVHVRCASGDTTQLSDSLGTVLSGVNVVARNVGGFTVGSGTIQIPTGSGYTHAIVRSRWAISGHATLAGSGIRQTNIQVSGGAQNPGAASASYYYAGTPWANLSQAVAPVNTPALNSNVFYDTPIFPISGGETLRFQVVQSQGSALGLVPGTDGLSTFWQVQCFKLTSGGVG